MVYISIAIKVKRSMSYSVDYESSKIGLETSDSSEMLQWKKKSQCSIPLDSSVVFLTYDGVIKTKIFCNLDVCLIQSAVAAACLQTSRSERLPPRSQGAILSVRSTGALWCHGWSSGESAEIPPRKGNMAPRGAKSLKMLTLRRKKKNLPVHLERGPCDYIMACLHFLDIF